MKQSMYNHLYPIGDDKKIIFNAMSCALAEVDESFFKIYDQLGQLEEAEMTEEQKEMYDGMKKAHFIVDKRMDEVQQVKFRHLKGKYGNFGLGLTIAPTLACNFKCPYCYETPENKLMSQADQDAIVKLAEETLKTSNTLDISWYGGEPMLGKDVIWSLSERLIKICDEKEANYNAFIVSNGYLITPEVIQNFLKYKITGIQVTLDGPPEVHNTRRILHNNGATFDVILENMRQLRAAGIGVNLRINIDKTNIDSVPALLDLLIQEGMQDMPISLGQVTAYTEACSSVAGSCLNTEEYAQWCLSIQKTLHEKGFQADGYPYYPGVKANYCCADQINAFVVDPNGYMYKCWNNVGLREHAVGNIKEIFDEEIPAEYIMNHAKWLTHTPFDVPECTECSILPMCMGGCPHEYYSTGAFSCEKWKFNLEDVIQYTYVFKTAEEVTL